MPAERLQKILSRAGISSRRQAEELLLAGQVRVNGKVVQTLGAKADPKRDKIKVKGKLLPRQQTYHYYAYYKPKGVVVTKKDERGRKGIFDLLKLPNAVNSVGRLDKDSEGLLLLSDDGDFVYRYTHPSFQIPKVYHVQVSRRLTRAEQRLLTTGIEFEEGTFRATKVKNLTKKEAWIEMELREGRKREIRRMLEFLQVKVLRLIRIQHGSVALGKLKPGEMIPLKRIP